MEKVNNSKCPIIVDNVSIRVRSSVKPTQLPYHMLTQNGMFHFIKSHYLRAVKEKIEFTR
jgi:hypothetical protein